MSGDLTNQHLWFLKLKTSFWKISYYNIKYQVQMIWNLKRN